MTEAAVLKSSGRLVGAVFVLAALAAGRPALAAACEDPTFGNPTSLGLSPVRLEIGDVNGDGKLDIVSIENGSIKVLFGNGDGTFAAPVSTPGPASPTASVLGQWNGDTLIDLAVASGVGSGSSITTFLGTVTGFVATAGGPYAVGSTVRSLATADFDRNGTADALVVGSAADVYLLRGNGDGTFQSPLGTSLGPADVVRVGDFNGDLFPDLALLRRRLVNDVAISLNDGTGAFRPLLSPTNSFPDATQDFVTDDFDRDGRLDLAVISQPFGKALNVRLGNGGGTFGASTSRSFSARGTALSFLRSRSPWGAGARPERRPATSTVTVWTTSSFSSGAGSKSRSIPRAVGARASSPRPRPAAAAPRAARTCCSG